VSDHCGCEFTNDTLASGMRRLKGQIATPVGFPQRLKNELVERGYVRFHEWPSGHWSITDRGHNFLVAQP
jgi:hypothetical protein